MKEKCFISSIEDTKEWHRSHYIIHKGNWYFAEFETGRQLDFFMETVGLQMGNLIERHYVTTTEKGEKINLYQKSNLNVDFIDSRLFWDRSELPEKVKPIKALSNGSIVTCYFLVEGKTLFFYRPNPNASRNTFDPLPLDQHINHVRTYGLY